ncbi:MAG: hypothetical protein ABIQ06_06930 [Caldimonas sp.]
MAGFRGHCPCSPQPTGLHPTMTAKNLSTVATDIVETYGKTAINAITTYRVGTERLIDFVDHRVAAAAVKGVMTSATGAQRLVTTAVRVASRGIERFASYAGRVEGQSARNSVQVFARAALPAANLVSNVAERLEIGSDHLVKRVAEGRSAIERPVVVRKNATRTRVVAGKRKIGAQKATPVKAVAKRSTRRAAR